MQKLELNILSPDSDYLLAYALQLANWLVTHGSLVAIRISDESTQNYANQGSKNPEPITGLFCLNGQNQPVFIQEQMESDLVAEQNKAKDNLNIAECKMYSVVETDWLATSEILINLNDQKTFKNRVLLIKDNSVHSQSDRDAICAIADHQPGLKTFSSADFKGLTAFIKKRNDVILHKKQLRKMIASRKKDFSEEELANKSASIRQQIEINGNFLQAKTVFCYWSLPDEVDTQKLIISWFPHKRFILPVVVGNELILKEFTGRDNMQPEPRFGILEPCGATFTDFNTIDLAIIPGVAFDKEMNRLGRGKGYYDRILKAFNHKIPLIGLGFDFQIIETVPTEEHDRPMNLLISDNA